MSAQDWKKDSDTIFTAVSTSGALDFKDAKRMVIMFYLPDMSFSRDGIADALRRLQIFWRDKK